MLIEKLKDLILIHFAIAVIGLGSAYAGSYRWVDDDGTIYYSDNPPPPSKAQRKQEVLNEQGITVKTIAAPKTPDELEAEARLAKKQAAERKLQEAAERRDRVLLVMYATVGDIEYIRDERIARVDAIIEITKLREKKFLDKLQELDVSEQRFIANIKKAPPWIAKSRAHYQGQLSNIDEILEFKEQERLEIKKRFSDDIERYLELTQPGLAVQ